MIKRILPILWILALTAAISACGMAQSEEAGAPSAEIESATVTMTETEPALPSEEMVADSAAGPTETASGMTEEQLQRFYSYWAWDEDWSFTMPCHNGYGDTWHVGLGFSYEFGLGIPYEFVGFTTEPAQDLAALSFSAIERRYWDGLNVVTMSGFYGQKPDEMDFPVNQYISTTQPDCLTPRGIHVGDTVEAMRKAYPEAYDHEGYWTEDNKDSGIAAHESCWIYAPEGTNRSILFLVKDGVIVQIDMADGLDGQYTFPAWTGRYQEE